MILCGLSLKPISAISIRATDPPVAVGRTIPWSLSIVSYSSSAYSTFTSISFPSTFRVVAVVPLTIMYTWEATAVGESPSAAALTGSTLIFTRGALFSREEWMFVASGRFWSSETISSDAFFKSSYCVLTRIYSRSSAAPIDMVLREFWLSRLTEQSDHFCMSRFHSLMT